MSETVLLAGIAVAGTLLAPIVQELIVHRRRRRHRLAALRRAPYARWLRATRSLIDAQVDAKRLRQHQDATFTAMLYATPRTAAALAQYSKEAQRVRDSINFDTSLQEDDSFNVLAGGMIADMESIRTMMLEDLSV